MDWINSLSAVTSPIILVIIITGVIAMYRTGALQFILSKNDEKENKDFDDGKWQGEVSATLGFMQKDIQEIKEDSRAMRERLGKHLDDEEQKLDITNARLAQLENNYKNERRN